MLMDYKKIYEFESADQFVIDFGLEKEFKEKYLEDVETHELLLSDNHIIESLLKDKMETYLVIFCEDNEDGYFKILEF